MIRVNIESGLTGGVTKSRLTSRETSDTVSVDGLPLNWTNQAGFAWPMTCPT
jgi:hypothetical protein